MQINHNCIVFTLLDSLPLIFILVMMISIIKGFDRHTHVDYKGAHVKDYSLTLTLFQHFFPNNNNHNIM